MTTIQDLYYYAEDSPSGLRWKCNRYRDNNFQVVSAIKGAVAGSQNNSHKYWLVSNGNGKYLRAHRVVWELTNGVIPEDHVVDHIDGDISNNRIENLRCIHYKENARNRRRNSNNTSKVTGVGFNRKINQWGIKDYWRAKWKDINGKEKAKYFSVDTYGYEQAFQLACQWREQKIAELNEQGAGYSERHGK